MAKILFNHGRIGLILCFSLLVSPLSGCRRQINPSGGSTLQPTHAAISTTATEISTEQDPLLSMDLSTANAALETANALIWLPGGRFAVAAQDNVALVDSSAAQTSSQELPVMQAAQPSKDARFLTASPSGEELAWVSQDTQVQLWHVAESFSVQALRAAGSSVTGLTFSPDGDQLAFATLDGGIVGLDADSQVESFTWKAPAWLSNLSISPNGTRLGGVDLANFLVYIYDLDGSIQKTLEWSEHASPALYSANFSPDWRSIAWVARGTVQLMSVDTGELGSQISHEDFVISCVWSPDSRQLATAAPVYNEGQMKMGVFVWDPSNGQRLERYLLDGNLRSMVFSPEGDQLAILDENGILNVINLLPK
jgi:WD40 repeat protein